MVTQWCATRPCDAGHVARSQGVGGIELLVTIGLMLNKVWFANFTGLVLGVMAIQVGAVAVLCCVLGLDSHANTRTRVV